MVLNRCFQMLVFFYCRSSVTLALCLLKKFATGNVSVFPPTLFLSSPSHCSHDAPFRAHSSAEYVICFSLIAGDQFMNTKYSMQFTLEFRLLVAELNGLSTVRFSESHIYSRARYSWPWLSFYRGFPLRV